MSACAVSPTVASHEARHAAAARLLGLDVEEVRADNPSPDPAGHVTFSNGKRLVQRPREHAVMILVGRWGDPDWPPEMPSKAAATKDERQVAEHVESLGLGRPGYELLVADAEHLVGAAAFQQLAGHLEILLAGGCVLDQKKVRHIHEFVSGGTQLAHKTVDATSRTTTDLGEFSALAATWSVDREGDQIVRGAFRDTITRWRGSGKKVPLHWNHSAHAKDIIGSVDPSSMNELPEGLFVRGKLDLNNEVARDVWPRMKDNAVSLSFGYLVTDKARRPDGIRELREIDLFEVSIVPAPANADTRILSVKAERPKEEPSPDDEAEPRRT